MANIKIRLYPGGPFVPFPTIKGDAFVYGDFTEEQLERLVGPRGPEGQKGERGEPFAIDIIASSVQELVENYQDIPGDTYAMISNDIENPENGQLYIMTENGWRFVVDLSGPKGATGEKGLAGIVVSEDEPEDRNVVWVNTNETYDSETYVVLNKRMINTGDGNVINLENNYEYRRGILEANPETGVGLTLILPDDIPDDFNCKVIFKTPSEIPDRYTFIQGENINFTDGYYIGEFYIQGDSQVILSIYSVGDRIIGKVEQLRGMY